MKTVLPVLLVGLLLTALMHANQSDSVQYISDTSRRLQPAQLKSDIARAGEGHHEAAYRVACHFIDSRDAEKGLKWMRVACVLGYNKAQHEFYVQAISLPDLDKATQIEALLWLERACETYEPARATKKNNLELRGTLNGHNWK